MPDRTYDLHGVRIFECDAEGAPFRTDRDAVDLIPTVWSNKASWIALPVERLGADFFRLETRIAGEIVQKFVGYRLRVAIVGDISLYMAESPALRAWVRESNRGNQIWFVASIEELGQRLNAA